MDHHTATSWIEPQDPHYQPIASFDPYTYSSTYYAAPHQPQFQNPNPQTTLTNDYISSNAASQPPQTYADSYATAAYSYQHYPSYVGTDSIVPGQTLYQDYASTQTLQEKQGVGVKQYVAKPVTYAPPPPAAAAANADTRPSTTIEPVLLANSNPIYWNNPSIQRPTTGTKRKFPKKAKIIQSAWCEVCKIDCTSRDVLNKHRLGKKHKKSLEDLEEAKKSASGNVRPAPMVNNPITGVQVNRSINIQQLTNKATPSGADLETKRRKVVQGGAANEAVRVCTICNVVCNSDIVFHFHLSGQKHAAMVKKHEASTAPQVVTTI